MTTHNMNAAPSPDYLAELDSALARQHANGSAALAQTAPHLGVPGPSHDYATAIAHGLGLAGTRDAGGPIAASMPEPAQSIAPPDQLAAFMAAPQQAAPPPPQQQPGAPLVSVNVTPQPGSSQPQQSPPDMTAQRLADLHAKLDDQRRTAAMQNMTPEQRGQAEIDAVLARQGVPPEARTPAPSQAAPARPAAPAPAPDLPDVQYAPVGSGGVVPAHEAFTRGPQQEQHLEASFAAPAEAAQQAAFRNALQAQHADDLYAQQAEEATRRREVADAVAAKRQQELAAMQQDYRDSVDRLGSMSIDTNRSWANKSTPEKIATSLLVALGGIASFGTGQRNPALDRVMSDISSDVDAQKFDYQMAADTVKAKQTAFGQMLEKYGSEDAAAAAARAAGIDYATAKIQQLAAQWKGTDSANAADAMLAQLASERERTIADGFRFIPAAASGQRYQVSVRGQLLPGTVSEAEARQIAIEHGVKPAERTDDALVKGAIDAQIAQQKNQGERANKTNEETRALATEIQKAGIPKLRALVTAADAALTKNPGGAGEVIARGAVNGLAGNPIFGRQAADTVYNRISPEAAAREEAFQALQNASWHDLSGGAITPTEESRLKKEGAGLADPAGRQRWIQRVRNVIGAAEDNLKAGASDEARAEYDRRKAAINGQRTAMPPGAKKFATLGEALDDVNKSNAAHRAAGGPISGIEDHRAALLRELDELDDMLATKRKAGAR